MAPRRFTLSTSHLLMWSSPLLLLVLVFTLNSRPLHAATTALATTTTITTLRTTTTISHPHRAATSPTTSSKTPTTSTTTPQVHRSNPVAATTTSVSLAHSSVSTATSVAPSAIAEDRTGNLTLDSPEAIFPLHGPGRWSLVASHAVTTVLICGSHSLDVGDTVRVAANQTCQLAITVATGAPTSWTLRAIR